MKIILPLFLNYAGFLAIALTMKQPQKKLWPSANPMSPRRFWAIRLSGWLALILALKISWIEYGTGIGITVWMGCLSLAGFSLSLLSVYQPRLAMGLLGGNIFSLVIWPAYAWYLLLPLMLLLSIEFLWFVSRRTTT